MSETRGIATAQMPDWRTLAACADVDPDVMFPKPSDAAGTARAKAVCSHCPVRDLCLADAMSDEGGKNKDRRHGILGGLTPSQRYSLHHRLRMRQKKQAAA